MAGKPPAKPQTPPRAATLPGQRELLRPISEGAEGGPGPRALLLAPIILPASNKDTGSFGPLIKALEEIVKQTDKSVEDAQRLKERVYGVLVDVRIMANMVSFIRHVTIG